MLGFYKYLFKCKTYMNLETLIYSLILAVVSGLAFVAYRHPNGYEKIFIPSITLTSMAIIFVLASNFGTMHAHIRLLKDDVIERPEETIQQAAAFSINELNNAYDNILIVSTVGVAIIGYLFFLYKLPVILGIKSGKECP